MEWLQFSIKILGVNFGHSFLNNFDWDKTSIINRIHIWNRAKVSLRGKKRIAYQILSSKLWYIYTIAKYRKKKLKDFLWNRKKSDLSGTYNHFHNILRIFDVLQNFHHKWNNVRFLFINMVYTSCITSCQTT